MLPNEKHLMVELERLAEQQQRVAEYHQFGNINQTMHPAFVRHIAGWLGSRLTTWGTQLEAYSQNRSARLLTN